MSVTVHTILSILLHKDVLFNNKNKSVTLPKCVTSALFPVMSNKFGTTAGTTVVTCIALMKF